MTEKQLVALWPAEEESWNGFGRRVREAEGEVIVVLASADNARLAQEDDRTHFLEELAKLRYRLKLATKDPQILAEARRKGIRTIDRTRKLRTLLAEHESGPEALRRFSPSLWRQQWRSRLQTIGLLSVPRARIFTLVGVSVALFAFVVLRLLPSATVRVWARSDIVTQTMNVTLVSSGAALPLTARVRTQPLYDVAVLAKRAITFDDISPEFTGTDASVDMTVINDSKETYSFRAGTRLVNQAGMIFRIRQAVSVGPGEKKTVAAKAEHLDLYQKIIGARGNVPAGLEWEFPGLPVSERAFVKAKNMEPGKGGSTAERTVLQQKDIDAARKRLRQELLVSAQQLLEEERQLRSARDPTMRLELLAKTDIIRMTESGFVLPTQFLGQPVKSVPIEGQLLYSIPAYNLQAIQEEYSDELQAHASEGKRLIPDSVGIDPEKVIVIEYADDGTKEHKYTGEWVKITADITGTEQFVLDPQTPTGAKFGKRVREAIAGLSVHDAQRILRNFPEVERVEISLWPPWSGILPSIPSNITITPQ